MLLVVLGIVVSTAAGVVAEKRWHDAAIAAADRAIRVILYALLPFVTFFAVARLELTAGIGIGLLLGYLELAAVGAAAWFVARRVLRLGDAGTGAVVVGTVVTNTGFLGIPLAAAIFGRDSIATAVTWDLSISAPMLLVVGFGIGAALGTKAGETPRDRARAFVMRNPPLLALAAALVAPDALAPQVLADIAQYAVIALLPVGFFILGVHLRQEADDGTIRFPPPITAPVAVVVGLRVVAAPALFAAGALGARALADIDVPDAYYTQAGMASGINGLVVAHVYGLDLRIAAGAVAWTTTVVVVAALVVAGVT